MGVHPERAAKPQRKVVVGAAARRDWWSGDVGHAVLLPRRGEAVPVDQARLVDIVYEAYPERLSDLRHDSRGAVLLPDGEYRGGFTIDVERAALQLEDRRWRGGSARAWPG